MKALGIFILLLAILASGCQAGRTTSLPASEQPTSPGETMETGLPTASEVSTQTESETMLYKDPNAPIPDRVEDLLARMTLEEKIGQMTQVEKNSILPRDITGLYIGSILSGGGGYPVPNTPEGWVDMVEGFQEKALDTRLGIPLIYGVDAVHGHNNLRDAVIFPHNVGLGATRDPDLVYRIGRATAEEVAATGVHWNFAPVVAVPQDIRWGRAYEAYGEDTGLVSILAEAYLRGLQGEGLSAPATVLATPKHYVGDGGTRWGSSTTWPYLIDQGVTDVDEATLRAIHLPPYQVAIEAGALSVMTSFSSWEGLKMSAQKYLITEVLKGELGFKGFVVSDWAAIDQVSPDYYQAVATAFNAGIDMNMVPYEYKKFIDTLKSAVEKGDVPQERIDDAVRRILYVKFTLGLFEQPYADPELLSLVGTPEHRQLAREAVAKSLVLLKNDAETLPLSKEAGVIFVSGEFADDIGAQCGGWTIEWQGKLGSITAGTTILEAVQATASEARIEYNRFANFNRLMDDAGNPLVAEVGIVVVGEKPYAEMEGDREQLALSEDDLNLIERARQSSQQLVVILITGRPLALGEALPMADAVVVAWLPGSEGQGIADVLFGDQPFSGKLPYTWPRAPEQLPFDFDNLGSGEQGPAFPFGYGLEY